MHLINIHKKLKLIIMLLVSSVVLFGFLCTGMFSKTSTHMSSMEMGVVSQQQEQLCCSVGISQHLSSWKNIILVTPDSMRDTLLLLSLALGFIGLSFLYRQPDKLLVAVRLYIRQNPNFTLFDHLKLAFAQGILNTKVY